eukprot:CAMPEP_0116036424 /NCGR_PEP_ID=MMETSP0321-20121206/21195_1 /TAXON_ID=163516 /ORGANISM="Leptocylindrus danicus var. danicus, Strain B650" /LENGTH=222 /DNA_ID=CAMNT_0003513925 /DNA_START=197 /DNA_END=865 /DNA_ORIENTATION=-
MISRYASSEADAGKPKSRLWTGAHLPDPKWYAGKRKLRLSDLRQIPFDKHRAILYHTWQTYIYTFEGMFPGISKRVFGKEFDLDEDGQLIDVEELEKREEYAEENGRFDVEGLEIAVTEQVAHMEENFDRNADFLKKRGDEVLKVVKEETGIQTKEELKIWLEEQMKLGVECLSEFMKGYRHGRDEEVDKMLHEYFKDLDEEKDRDDAGDGEKRKNEGKSLM